VCVFFNGFITDEYRKIRILPESDQKEAGHDGGQASQNMHGLEKGPPPFGVSNLH
jgi:hypothetical protein